MHALTSAIGHRSARPSPGWPARTDPRHFGKRFAEPVETPLSTPGGATGSDLRLFAITFAAGFLFVSIFIA